MSTMDLLDVYERTSQELKTRQRELLDLMALVEKLRRQTEVLGEVIREAGLAPPAVDRLPDPDGTTDWTDLTRREAVQRLLHEAHGPLSPSGILEMLQGHGRENDRPQTVSATLANLKKAGKVQRVGFGAWALAEGEEQIRDEGWGGDLT